MTVFADTPRWPRHGLLWGHLISDASLAELHAAAERCGLPPRAFDLDHYDWPESARADLEAAGVRFVGAGELTRALVGSGLRIPLRDRPAARSRRTAEDAAALGLAPAEVPTDLVLGLRGHADPLPPAAGAPAGAFRIGRDRHGEAPRVQAHDAAGRTGAARMLARLDALARDLGEQDFVGQLLQLPASSEGEAGPVIERV